MNPNLEPDPSDLTFTHPLDAPATEVRDDSPAGPSAPFPPDSSTKPYLQVGQCFVLNDQLGNPWAAWARIVELKGGWVRYLIEDGSTALLSDGHKERFARSQSQFLSMYVRKEEGL